MKSSAKWLSGGNSRTAGQSNGNWSGLRHNPGPEDETR